jgi:acyl-CoA synthetase (AMP-forming)/AMP-acid ligase II
MLALGLGTGDRVVLFANNSPEYLEIYMGLQLAGLVAVPANYRLTTEELAYLVNNSRSSALVIGEEFLPLLKTMQTKIPFGYDKIVVIGGDHAKGYERLIGAASSSAMPSRAHLASLGAVFYTSGTTGFPKGAMMSHLTMLTRFGSWGWRFGITEDEVTLVPGPIFHQSFGSVGIQGRRNPWRYRP